eukprot:GFYU01000147.1.p1 GENE.GFYU01000147.1~~GFYU01000147.1.p1  ORF type:complete len:196 (-),score=20.67 GFYU01000147.1:198-785(-)
MTDPLSPDVSTLQVFRSYLEQEETDRVDLGNISTYDYEFETSPRASHKVRTSKHLETKDWEKESTLLRDNTDRARKSLKESRDWDPGSTGKYGIGGTFSGDYPLRQYNTKKGYSAVDTLENPTQKGAHDLFNDQLEQEDPHAAVLRRLKQDQNLEDPVFTKTRVMPILNACEEQERGLKTALQNPYKLYALSGKK